jgi:hypothetical protein
MKMKKNGDRKNWNSKRDIKEKRKVFTMRSLQINNAGHAVNMVI